MRIVGDKHRAGSLSTGALLVEDLISARSRRNLLPYVIAKIPAICDGAIIIVPAIIISKNEVVNRRLHDDAVSDLKDIHPGLGLRAQRAGRSRVRRQSEHRA